MLIYLFNMSSAKENKIQEAIRLVQECNFSRRKAASSTGISPNTLKRRLNGSIPREEYLEKTKKITASEELILENMIISLIQQGEHVKASTLRLLVAIYIKNKTEPTNFHTNKELVLESIPKGWCSRFMKRSNNLAVNQGIVEIVDKNLVESLSELPSAFSVLLPPPESDAESLAATREHIANSATVLIENFRIEFESLKQSCTVKDDSSQLLNVIEAMSTLFQDISTLATILNFTSHVSKNQEFPIQYLSKNRNIDNSSFSDCQKVKKKDTFTTIKNTTGIGNNAKYNVKSNQTLSKPSTSRSQNASSVLENPFSAPSVFVTGALDTPISPATPQSNLPSGVVSKKRSSENLDSDACQVKMYHRPESKLQNWKRFSSDPFPGQSPTNYPVNLMSTESDNNETSSVTSSSTHLLPETWEKRPPYTVNFRPVYYDNPTTSDSLISFPYCPQQQFLNGNSPDEPVFFPNSCAINVASSVSMPTISDLDNSSFKNFDFINTSSSFFPNMPSGNPSAVNPDSEHVVNMGHVMNHSSYAYIVS